jgi:glycosyltransferase involved in cell wall biosynthesis
MKILHTVESYYPDINGMSEVVKQLSEGLTKLGHEVTVATSKNQVRKGKRIINRVNIIEFDISGKRVLKIFGDTKKYQSYLENSSFDIVANFAAQQWATDLMLPILPKIRAKKVLVPTGFSGLYSPIYHNYYQKMKSWMKEYDANIFLSENYRDIDFARKNNIRNIKVIPNGASEKEFIAKSKIDIRKKLGIPNDNFLVLTVGSHTGLKGHNEAIRIFNKAGMEKSTFLLIGKKTKSVRGCYHQCKLLKSLSGKNILIKDLTREETVAAFKAADIFLFTSQVECSPIVLFESIAAKIPFLTTDVGNAKEIIKWTKGGILLPTKVNKLGYSKAQVSESAKILKSCYHNPKKLSLMAKAGHKAWLKKFTWEKIIKEYEKVYLSLLKS